MAKFRMVSILPSMITIGSAMCGFSAIIAATHIHQDGSVFGEHDVKHYLQLAGWLIFTAYILDGIDGRVARLTNSVSKFGGELDSLADMVVFGVAPAFILLRMGPSVDRPVIYSAFLIAAFVYFACVMIRLARFNAESHSDEKKPRTFKGLPCPAAAGCIAALAISRFDIITLVETENTAIAQAIRLVLPLATIGLSLLMVSSIRYARVPTRSLRESRWFAHVALVLFFALATVLLREAILAAVFWGFAMFDPLYRAARQRFQLPELPGIDEDDEPESIPVEV